MPSELCHLWQIRSGVVRTLTWTDEGKVVPLGFWGAGSVIGASIARVFPYEIDCLSAVEAEMIRPVKPLSPATLLEHISQSSRLMQILHCSRIDCRLEQFIGWFADQFGQVQPDGVHLQVRLTHQELSEAVGTTRVTVTRTIRQLEEEGKISWSRHQQIVSQHLLEPMAIPG
ncbi:MAG: Crp/Fnr family transcriptional regulator [Merismopedia sp. SIO2A8]|nr:Crp/Fnr family transcriptional regulator [Merismopedia sp. SIO2A8]